MRIFLLVILVAARAACAPARPNIVYILADDLGYADCGFNGGKQIRTPHLDRLARAGAIFDAYYVQPLCSPTRAALLTGRYPMRYGLQVGVIRPEYHFGLPLTERTLAEVLREAGYRTAICGKWHLGSFDRAYWPNARGFDHAYGHLFGALDYFTHKRNGQIDWYRNGRRLKEPGYTTELIGKEAVRVIEGADPGKPFFLYVAFNAVHTPLQVPPRYLAPYTHLRGRRRIYAGMLAALDEAVGAIVAAVEKKGLRRQTLFIFSSDNGGFRPGVVTDNGPLRAGKATLYEGGVRVCAFATWDGRIPAGVHITEPVHIVDWYPTLLELAGAPPQRLALDGRTMWPVITEGKGSPHREILLNAAPQGGALRAGDWKLKLTGAEGKKQTFELFNLREDIGERHNLAEDKSAVVAKLTARYRALARRAVRPLVTTEQRRRKKRGAVR